MKNNFNSHLNLILKFFANKRKRMRDFYFTLKIVGNTPLTSIMRSVASNFVERIIWMLLFYITQMVFFSRLLFFLLHKFTPNTIS